MRRHALRLLLITAGALPVALAAQEVGPPRGALILAGGAVREPGHHRPLHRAGGRARGSHSADTHGERRSRHRAELARSQTTAGGGREEPDAPTHLRPAGGRHRGVRGPLREARGVWFDGGRQWRLADSYLNTLTHRELSALLGRGGVIGGSSAGATILGSYLARGDTETNTIMMGDHEEGLSLLRGVAVDQHVLKRNRHFDMLEIIVRRPELLGIGIDEDTALVVQGDQAEVIGQSYVSVYDSHRKLDSGGRFYFLAPGDRYDLKTRQPTRRTETYESLERVVEEPWSGK